MLESEVMIDNFKLLNLFVAGSSLDIATANLASAKQLCKYPKYLLQCKNQNKLAQTLSEAAVCSPSLH